MINQCAGAPMEEMFKKLTKEKKSSCPARGDVRRRLSERQLMKQAIHCREHKNFKYYFILQAME
jgi:hypothetical protein